MPMASWRRQHQPVEGMDTVKSTLVTNNSTTSSRHVKQTTTITSSQSLSTTTRNAIGASINESSTVVKQQNETKEIDSHVAEATPTSEASPTKKPKKKLSDASGKKKSKKSKKSEAEKENISVVCKLTVKATATTTTNTTTTTNATPAIITTTTTTNTCCIPTITKHEQCNPNRIVRFSLNNNDAITKSLENIHGKSEVRERTRGKNESKIFDSEKNKLKGSETYKENIGDWSSSIDVKKLRQLYQSIDENAQTADNALRHQRRYKSQQVLNPSNPSVETLNNPYPFPGKLRPPNACKSFGDLTILPKESKHTEDLGNLKRTKSVGDMLDKELNRIVLSGVSVKNLRESYCSLVTVETKENTKKKSSFSKFDALQKKNLIHVRSNDAGKAQEKFSEAQMEVEKKCRTCGKIVYKMEEIKAERNTWHKTCFKCNECGKQLNVDTYQSHESILYCKPHFRLLLAPKAVEDNEPVKPRKPELIIRENEPAELPPDVVRASDKPDLGLEDLQQLNVKERFQVFEHYKDQNEERLNNIDRSPSGVKRSTSILSKLAKFQAKGLNTGLDNASLSAIQYEDSSDTEEEEEDDIDDSNEDADLIRAKRAQRERPMSFRNMNDIKSKFESGHMVSREERREERKQEIQNIRSRLFMGKQARIKEMYQQAVAESEQAITSTGKKPEIDIGDKARMLKEKFEKGEIFKENKNGSEEYKLDEEMEVFEQGISKNSRSIFKNLESSQQQQAPLPNQGPKTPDANSKKTQVSKLQEDKCKPFLGTGEIVRSTDKSEDIKIETSEVSSKFRFFEQYRPTEKERKPFRITPPREGTVKAETEAQVDQNDSHADEEPDDKSIAKERHTTTKMLSVFRQMEESKSAKSELENSPKPLKRFTPPLDDNRRVYNDDSEEDYEEDESEEGDEEEEEEEESEEETPKKYDDEILRQAQAAARAKQLRAKFEKWEANEIQREMNNSSVNLYEYYENNDEGQVESAKSLRAKFEALQDTQTKPSLRPQVQVNRFV